MQSKKTDEVERLTPSADGYTSPPPAAEPLLKERPFLQIRIDIVGDDDYIVPFLFLQPKFHPRVPQKFPSVVCTGVFYA